MFVPGLGDPGPGAILPRPPLPDSLTADLRQQLPNALFTSNPCRIRHFTQVFGPLEVLRDNAGHLAVGESGQMNGLRLPPMVLRCCFGDASNIASIEVHT